MKPDRENLGQKKTLCTARCCLLKIQRLQSENLSTNSLTLDADHKNTRHEILQGPNSASPGRGQIKMAGQGDKGGMEDEEEEKREVLCMSRAELHHWRRGSAPSGAASVIKNGCSVREFD